MWQASCLPHATACLTIGLAAALLICSTADALAADVPKVKVTRVQSPKVDGSLSDACWQRAARCDLKLTSGVEPSQKTTAMICHDQWSLYIAFQCHESEMGKLVKGTTKRDGPHWLADCVELFIDPEGSGSAYLHFAVSAAGGQFDERVMDPSWCGEWRAATQLGVKGWAAEIEIPFASLGLTPHGSGRLRINFCREEKPHGENSSWAPVGESFHNPSKFGVMEIEGDLSRFFCRLGVLPGSYSVGANVLTVTIDNLSAGERRGSVRVVGLASDGTDAARAKRWLVAPAKGRSQCTLRIDLPKIGKYDLVVQFFQGQKRPVAVTRAQIEVPAIRVSPAHARIRWIRHVRDGCVMLMVVHDCAAKAEDVVFEAASIADRTDIEVVGEGRSIRSRGSRFEDRFCGYEVRLYRWRGRTSP